MSARVVSLHGGRNQPHSFQNCWAESMVLPSKETPAVHIFASRSDADMQSSRHQALSLRHLLGSMQSPEATMSVLQP